MVSVKCDGEVPSKPRVGHRPPKAGGADGNELWLVEYYGARCEACVAFQRGYKALAKAYKRIGVRLGAVDCERQPKLCAADGVLIPIQCEYFALEGVSALMGTIQKVQKMNRHLAIEGVVLTMLDARTNLGVQVAQEVRKVFKNKVYKTVIPRNVRLGEAPSHGLPIHLYDPRSLGAQSYQQLAKEFLERE